MSTLIDDISARFDVFAAHNAVDRTKAMTAKFEMQEALADIFDKQCKDNCRWPVVYRDCPTDPDWMQTLLKDRCRQCPFYGGFTDDSDRQ